MVKPGIIALVWLGSCKRFRGYSWFGVRFGRYEGWVNSYYLAKE